MKNKKLLEQLKQMRLNYLLEIEGLRTLTQKFIKNDDQLLEIEQWMDSFHLYDDLFDLYYKIEGETPTEEQWKFIYEEEWDQVKEKLIDLGLIIDRRIS